MRKKNDLHRPYYRLAAWVLCAWLTVLGGLAHAEPVQQKPGDLKKPQVGSDTSGGNCKDQHEGVLLAVIVPCIRDIVQEATETITDQFDEYLKAGAAAFAALVLVIFGIKAMTQEGDVKKEGFILLMKIGCMFLFMENFGGFIPAAFGTIQDGVEMVTSTLNSGNQQCDMSKFPGEAPWNYLDCVLGQLFGFGAKMVLPTSVFGITATMLSSQFGSSLAMASTFIFFFIIKLILRAVFFYLMALIVVGFLIIISPVLIPLLLLGATFQYFERWMRALVSTMIQPVIVLAYITMCFSIMDKMLFDDQKGLAKLLSPENITKYQNATSTGGTTTVANNGVGTYERAGVNKTWVDKDVGFNDDNPAMSDAVMVNGPTNEGSSFDMREERAQKSQNIFFSMVCFALMVYLLDNILDTLTQIMQAMLGGGWALGQVENVAETKLQQLQSKTGGGFQSVADGIKGMIGKT